MMTENRQNVRSVLMGLCGLVMAATAAHAQPLSLRIPDETAAPGGVVQVKLELTEPRPIFAGGGGMSFGGFDQFLGLSVHSPAGDAAALGVMRGSNLRVRMVSPTSDLGSAGEYPLLTTTLRVPATAAPGARSTLDMTGATFAGPGGVPYSYEVRSGVATVVAGAASVTDVTPGSGIVPAGGSITIRGVGFEPNTEVHLYDSPVSVTFVNAETLVVVPQQAVEMHAQEIEVRIRSTGQRLKYYAYHRTSTVGRSTNPLIGAVEPAFPRRFWTSSAVHFPSATTNSVYGVALQNEGTTASTVTLALVEGGSVAGPVQFVLPAGTRVVRSVSEVFGTTCLLGCALRMTATTPIQVLGVTGDLAADAATPVLPVAESPTVLGVSVQTNALSYRPGDLVTVMATLTPGPLPTAVDGYVVVTFPSGEQWSLTPGGLVPGLRPYFVNHVVFDARTLEVLRTPLPAGLPAGSYQWLTALLIPGTGQFLTPVTSVTFDVAP